MYIFYPIYLILKGLKAPRESIFIVSSNTFFAPALLHLVLRFKAIKVVHMLYDLFPDAIEIAGAIQPRSYISRLIGKITTANLKRCEATVFLGEFLKYHAETRWGNVKKSSVIDISTDLSCYEDQINLSKTDKVIVHYGGQLGHLHDAQSIIESVKYVLASDIKNDIEFNFYVSGAQATFLERSLSGCPVKIISAIPSFQWRKDIQNFHVGLVSLSPGGASVCLPSKTYGMMAGGMSILAIAPLWSDLSTLITTLDAGWVINNSGFTTTKDLITGDYSANTKTERQKNLVAQDFYACLKNIIHDREKLEEKREHAFRGVRSVHNLNVLSGKWKKILSDL